MFETARRIFKTRAFVRPFALVAFVSLSAQPAAALPGGVADRDDRFPYVVEIARNGRMICSGTVLYPRLVVTSAHCLQHVVRAWGRRIYVDAYLQPTELFVRVFRDGRMRSYAVEKTIVAPGWLAGTPSQSIDARLPYDMALLVTRVPINVDLPLHVLDAKPPLVPTPSAMAAGQRGVLVAFGGVRCTSSRDCADAGLRRYVNLTLQDSAACFKSRLEREAGLPRSVWCMKNIVLPGDSGGALLVEDRDGALRYAGVISAQRGLPPELAAVSGRPQSAAAALASNLEFIAGAARALGYRGASSDP
ncbi:MAG: hypothetical protein A49_19080 [Methyloceanibacter sp.]|nr:MAG: hypothetical protein A49_19080 [Methyloceanibacter sp.]